MNQPSPASPASSPARRDRSEFGPLARGIAAVVVPLTKVLARSEFRDVDRLPDGPFILAANHITKLDPLLMIRFMWEAGRMPHFLAKEQLFHIPVVGWVMRHGEQIPVDRHAHGGDSLRNARAWLERGQTVQIYPEGTLTRDPDLWPMHGKSGAVRLAQATGCPIVPVAQWGAQEILPRYGKGLHILPRKRFVVQVGDPIPASRYADLHNSADYTRATAELMGEITALLETLRGPRPDRPTADTEGAR